MTSNLSILTFLQEFKGDFFVKSFLILFLLFYSIFAIILFRQIDLMGRTIYSPSVPFLKFVAIVHIGVSLAILFFVFGGF